MHLATLVTELDLSQTATIVIILIPFMILGCFVDGISMILITMPIVFPIVTAIGFDGVLFGLLVVKMVEIGAITPPVGLNAVVRAEERRVGTEWVSTVRLRWSPEN